MEKYFKRTIFDELYEARGDEFADNILKEMSKRNEEFKSLAVEEKLTNKIKEAVQDEKLRSQILELLNKYELNVGNEEDFWNKMYYKFGAYDCANIKEVLQNQVDNNNAEDTKNVFFDEHSDDFLDYLESNRMRILKENAEYKELAQKIEKIKVDNPNVRTFIEDKEAVDLTDVELNAVLDILELQAKMDNIELKQTFKLGAREIMIFLKQMRLL